MLELSGEKIILREFSKENLYDKRYHNWLRDLEVVSHLYRPEYLKPLDFQQIESYVATMFSSENDCFFAMYYKQPEEFIGTFRIGHINWRSGVADLGIMIGNKAFWGKGIATEALRLGVQYALTTLSLRKLGGGTSATNVAMCKSFEKVGFIREAVKRKELLINGEFVDHIHYGLLKEDVKL